MRFIKLLFLTSLLVVSLQAREQVNIKFSNLQISDFIKLVSKITHKNILVNNKVNGTVNLISTAPIYDDELLDILISVLESKGYTLVKKGSIYEIVRSVEAAKDNLSVVKRGKTPYGSLMVTQVIQIHGENVDIIASKIRYLISKTAKLMTMKENNKLLLTDYPKNIQTIKKVIKDIDIHNNMIVKIFDVEHTDAKKIQSKLSNIAKNIFNQKIAYEKVQIILDENLNAIIVVGTPQNVKIVQQLLKQLDVEANNSKRVEVFELKNSDAKSVLASLNSIVSKQVYSDPSMKPNISSSEEINSIIVVGEPIIIKAIKQIIDKLDREKYQVYVTARIVNINKTDSESIGVKYGFAAGNVSPSGIYAMSANFGSSALTNTASQSIINFLGNIGTAAKTGLALGATLDFLQTNGAAKDISNPSILCVNNKESSIYVGKTISIASGQTAVAGSTTSSFKREDVGLTLTIKPRVSSDDKVGLKVESTLGSIVDNGLENGIAVRQPVTSKETVKTEVILRNGESIIIGGLFKKSEQFSTSKVPLLGDIPLIGKYLFSSNGKTITKDSLVVILTPYIISKSEKLSALQEKLGQLTIMQNRYDEAIFSSIKEKAKKKQKLSTNTTKVDPKDAIFGIKGKR